MSLLDVGTDQVTLYASVSGTDADGNPVLKPSASAVTITCRVQPVASAQNDIPGQALITTYRVLTRTWPAGAYSRAEWAGREWDVIGEPLRSAGSLATRHVEVLLRARGPGSS